MVKFNLVTQVLKPMPNLPEFFTTEVKKALQRQSLDISQEVEFYLVHLLTRFAVSENFYKSASGGGLEDRPLALRLYDSVFDPENKFIHLKNLGDTALYQAGVFYDGLYNRVVNVDYYISMGGQAYCSLANMKTSSEKTLADMFAELGERFPALVEILNLVCEKESTGDSNHDLLKLLDRYQKTGSEKARQILEAKGLDVELLLQPKNVQ